MPSFSSSPTSSSSSGVDNQTTTTTSGATMVDNFNENFSGSLEDLVSTFDEKITKCFCNFNETTEKIAPVQVGKGSFLVMIYQPWSERVCGESVVTIELTACKWDEC